MKQRIFEKLSGNMAVLVYIALAAVLGHLLISGNYGYFLDELYTLACSRHLSLAFVDIPPVAPALLALNTLLFGDSLIALHIFPSLFSGAAVLMTGLLAKELGGGRIAILLSGLAAAFVPIWMAIGSLYTYDFLDQFVLIVFFYVTVVYAKRENPRMWLVIGALAGIALMTKPSAIFFIAAMALSLLLTKHRRVYLTPWPWLGALIALLIILPAFLWQLRNGFPIVAYWGAYSQSKAVHTNILEFILMQVVGVNFALLPLWCAGLLRFLRNGEGERYRLLAVVYLVLFVVFALTGAKLYMLGPAYAMLLAGGAITLERFVRAKGRGRRWMLYAYTGLITVTGLLQAPNFMPILPVDSLVAYYDTVGSLFGAKTLKLDNSANVELPQYFYDRLEWDVLVNDVAEVYFGLSQAERENTAILTQNYGWAGAIDQFGSKPGLPEAVCGQLNYYFFSLNNLDSQTWIIIGESQDALREAFDDVTLAKLSQTKYRQPYELPIFVCRGVKFTQEEARIVLQRFE